MSAAATQQNTRQSKLDALTAKIRAAVGRSADLERKFRLSVLATGRLVAQGAPLFTAEQRDEYIAWGMDATGWSESNLTNVLKAVGVIADLDERRAEQVSAWEVASVVALAPAEQDEREVTIDALAEQNESKPAPKLVRQMRNAAQGKDPNPPKRERKGDPEATIALANEIREQVESLAGGPVALAMVGAAQMVADRESDKRGSGRLIPDAIAHVLANPVTDEDESDK